MPILLVPIVQAIRLIIRVFPFSTFSAPLPLIARRTLRIPLALILALALTLLLKTSNIPRINVA